MEKKLLKRKVYYEQIIPCFNRFFLARRFNCLYFCPGNYLRAIPIIISILELAIEAVKNTEWEYAVLFGIFVLLIGIPVLCFLILAIVHNFKLLAKPQRIRVGNQVYTALFSVGFGLFPKTFDAFGYRSGLVPGCHHIQLLGIIEKQPKFV